MSTPSGRIKPRYIELSEILRARIESGEYAVDTLMPTELELCDTFDVSRYTARSALARLLAAGMVNRRPGAGTRVIARHEAIRYSHAIDTVDGLMQYGSSTRLSVLEIYREHVDAKSAEDLEVGSDKECLRLICVRREERDGEPIAHTEMLVPVRRGVPLKQLQDIAKAPRAVNDYLNLARLSCVEQYFDAAHFTKKQAEQMGVSRGAPAMRVRRRYRDQNGQVMMVAVSLHPEGKLGYSMTLSRVAG